MNKKITKFLINALAISTFLILPVIVLAKTGVFSGPGLVPCGGPDQATCGFSHIFILINTIVDFILFKMVVPIAAIMFAYAGFLLLTSGGEASKKTKAKKIFTNVAIGLVLAVAAFLIVKTILSIAGYNTGDGWNWFGF